MEDTKRINIAIEKSLHKELKIAAATNGITVKEYVSKAIRDKIERDNEERDKKG